MNDYGEIYSIIWLIFFGICFAAFYAYFTKHFLGSLIRRLIDVKASSESTAKSLSELGYGRFSAFALGRCLKQSSGLRRYVEAVFPEEKGDSDLLVSDGKTVQKYYLPYDKYETAEKRYDDKGTTLGAVFLTVAVFFVVALLSMVIMPFIVNIFTPKEQYDEDVNNRYDVTENHYGDNGMTAGSENDASESDNDDNFSMLTPTGK